MEGDKQRQDLQCLCCYELMVNPTTLGCGHSFCRHCLAEWYKRSKKPECMICRKKFEDIPAVSFTIKSLAEDFFKEEYEERCKLIDTPNNKQLIKTFEEAIRKTKTVESPQHHSREGYIILGVIILAIFVIYQVLFKNSEPSAPKPVQTWSHSEVIQWLTELGVWTEPVIQNFRDFGIDGNLLLTLANSPEELEPLMKDLHPLYQKTFKMALESTVGLREMSPKDFWEYKDTNLYAVVCMVTIAIASPRTYILLTFFFNYKHGFLPLIHRVCPVLEGIDIIPLYTYEFPGPTFGQWLDFLWKACFFPHFTVFRQFIAHTVGYTNYTVYLYLNAALLLYSFRDIIQIYQCVDQPRKVKEYFTQLLIQWRASAIILCLFYIFWILVPTFMINSYLFYVGVWQSWKYVYRVIKGVNNAV